MVRIKQTQLKLDKRPPWTYMACRPALVTFLETYVNASAGVCFAGTRPRPPERAWLQSWNRVQPSLQSLFYQRLGPYFSQKPDELPRRATDNVREQLGRGMNHSYVYISDIIPTRCGGKLDPLGSNDLTDAASDNTRPINYAWICLHMWDFATHPLLCRFTLTRQVV